MPARSLLTTLRRQYAELRRASIARLALRAAAGIALWIALSVAVGALRPPGPLAAWIRTSLALAVAVGLALFAAWRHVAGVPRFAAWLEAIEDRFPAVRSWLRNALELESGPPAHGSPELSAAVADETGRRLADVDVAALSPKIEPRRPVLIAGAAAALLVAFAFASPSRTRDSWASLLDPNLAAPPVELTVAPGNVRVTPGSALAVRARVSGSGARPHLARERGPAPEATLEAEADGSKVWRFDLPPVTREDRYRVAVARVSSPRYEIALVGEPSPVSFEIEYRSPAYARLPLQRGAGTRGDLSALRGTRARVEVTFDRDLLALEATLPGGAPARFVALTPRRWSGEVPVEREGDWQLFAHAETGAARFGYRITPLADAPPVIAVHAPTNDLDLPTGQQIALEVVGQDDLGLSSLELQYHKDAAAAWTRVPLARFAKEPREAGLSSHWDASTLGLLPGETATFRFALYDNNVSGRGEALSPTFELRFPSLSQLYDQIDDKQGKAQSTLEKVAEQSRELQKQLDKLARQNPTQSPEGAPGSQGFERQEEMKHALEQQQNIGQKIDDAAQQLHQSLEQAAERQAYGEELNRKLKELADLMNQIQSPELKDALKKMQQAIEQLDRQTLEQKLPELRRQNQETLANLERSIELMKRLREEEKLDALAKRAEELERQQDALNKEHAADAQQKEGSPKSDAQKDPGQQTAGKESDPKGGDSKSSESKQATAERQQQAASESKKLADATEQMKQQMDEAQAKQALDEAQQQLQQEAAAPQSAAAEASQSSQPQRALQEGRRASAGLKKAGQSLNQLSQQMRQEREGADLAAVRRSAQDLVSLQRESERNLASKEGTAQRGDRQTDLSEGVSRVADSLSTLAEHSPFLSPKLKEALGRAIQNFATSGRALGTGDRIQGEQTGRNGSAALNEAVLSLRGTEASMCQKPGNSPGGQNSAQRMGEMGEQQSQLNEQSRSVAKRLSQQMRLSAGDHEELQRLAEEQRRIREQLEDMQKTEEQNQKLLGRLDAARQEMKDVEETLAQGTPGDDLEEKQQRILSRLLDAQRSANRRDFEPERESRTGTDIARTSPADLPRDLLRETDRLRLDLLKAEADRYPAQYRAFIEAYLRSLNASRR